MDLAAHVGAVGRTVKNLEHDGQPAVAVVATRVYTTDIDDLWNALTTAERIPRWFLPITGDLQLGGRYQLKGNAGGEITKCDAPKHFALTWEYGGDTSWVDVVLTPSGSDRTHLELTHVAHVTAEKMAQFGPGAVGIGWDLGLRGLGEHVSGKPPIAREVAMAWMASDEGKSFMRESGNGWRVAAIEGGTPEEEANAAAARTIAAYCGES